MLARRREGGAGLAARFSASRCVGASPESQFRMKKAEAAVVVPGCGGAAPVPGFLAKLWVLVEDPGSDDVICWSPNGQNFSILDEQRFAKELLPKYFKHNNLSSFIRQLNIYGFRKVVALENGMMASAKNSAIEFQHPFFKREKFSLLANIKRKVSAVREEDLKVCPEDLHKVLSEVQEMREQQNNMDLKLANMKRENKALWKEVAYLRQKHSQQQKLLSKILEFILNLMRQNCIVGLKRKRSLSDGSGASPAKYGCQYIHIPVEDCETAAISEHQAGCEDVLIIRDITNVSEEDPGDCPERPLALAHTVNGNWGGQLPTTEGIPPCKAPQALGLELPEVSCPIQLVDKPVGGTVEESNAVELHSAQPGVTEDPAAVLASILDENQTVAQSGPVLEREEMQDFLNCIDASLEELQAALSGKKFSYGLETLSDPCSPELVLDGNLTEVPTSLESMEDLPENTDTVETEKQQTSGKKGMQLIQYRGNPLLSFLEDAPSSEVTCKMESANDVLLASLEERPPSPLSSGGEAAAQQFPDPAADGPGPEPQDPPLLPEDMNGEYKLFPLLLLSPVANFIEEASEIKPLEPDKDLLETASQL